MVASNEERVKQGNEAMLITKHFIVTGRVQGVFFRAATKQKADTLNLTGWVRNVDSGDVEVLAVGEEPALKQFEAWLHRGPSAAQVIKVSAETLAAEQHEKFVILR